jgi:hypothetical protein
VRRSRARRLAPRFPIYACTDPPAASKRNRRSKAIAGARKPPVRRAIKIRENPANQPSARINPSRMFSSPRTIMYTAARVEIKTTFHLNT